MTATGAAVADDGGAPATASAVLVAPVNAVFPPVGEAIVKDFAAQPTLGSPWTLKGWVRVDAATDQPRLIAALVDADGKRMIELGITKGQVFAGQGATRVLSPVRAKAGDWLLVSLQSNETGLVLTVGDAAPASLTLSQSGAPQRLVLAPSGAGLARFEGAVAHFALWSGDHSGLATRNWAKPDPELIQFESASRSWPLQVKQNMGMDVPQDPLTLPVSRAGNEPRFTKVRPEPTAALTPAGSGRWTIGGWQIIAAPETSANPEEISKRGFKANGWLPATVPGTALTSYVDNQVYPDPAYGLNNLLIPEQLNKQDYWYRTEFTVPELGERTQQSIEFQGINYASEIWINGQRIGETEGAFVRGRFALGSAYAPGDRVAIAVRVSPPPHSGLPHEESLSAGPGINGGSMTLDGPTFAASEGWDWIPSVRDRNTGIWQDVVFEATGSVRIGDPHVRTVLPKADNSLADLTIEVPVVNHSAQPASVTVDVRFDDVALTQSVELPAQGAQDVRFAPHQFAALRIANPKLWWPNGYGDAALHDLAITVSVDGAVSDTSNVRFGIREVSYDLSMVDADERLQRVAVAPARSSGEQLIDVSHEKIRKVEGGWAVSLARGIGTSPALTSAPDTTLAPNLLIRVNGVPIAVRGGNWGMDDWMKRVSRERMEPYFRLHRDANVNTIRNWMGQNTERVFFDLADEYGLLVLNDFWISTQDHNGEPGDTALFLTNAADTISRFRQHPSIALWIGRNEGVPPPVLNRKLEQLVRSIDGTRAYLPNSRQVNMSGSGPWDYRAPESYFNRLAVGFSTEVGTPSFPTLETFKAMMPEADQWPISDSWAYHDWHQGKAGDVASFMKALENRFGAASDLVDFEKKAQLLNYEAHRAIFEGMNAGLFTRNSGRLLWMTHPAWPSTAWQIYSYDYDTQASFFGAKKGMEPVHVQVNLPDRKIAVVNSLGTTIANAQLRVSTYDLSGKLLKQSEEQLDAAAYATSESTLALGDGIFDQSPVILTRLELYDAQKQLLSENFYWLARKPEAYRQMAGMADAQISIDARQYSDDAETRTEVVLTNSSPVPALMVKLSLLDEAGVRILPAYWSDNYVSLLPGETRQVIVRSPKSGPQPNSINVDGWNVEAASAAVGK